MPPKRPVVAIPPSYDQQENLEIFSTEKYLKYLWDGGAQTVMTTAGTSQFNLLNTDEIHTLNACISQEFSGDKILGIPPVNANAACEFVRAAKQYLDDKTHIMALYPDRFYDQQTIIDYVSQICDAVGSRIYLHAPKMRCGMGGDWNYDSDTVNKLYDKGAVKGLKEEHSNLAASYNFISQLNTDMDVIVAGGSMRRFAFLESAGANSFLSGVGNIFPLIEYNYFSTGNSKQTSLDLETKFFSVLMKHGWHKSLRAALKYLGLTCFHDRQPWPSVDDQTLQEISIIIEELRNES